MSALDTLLRDLKHAFRILRKNPAFTLAALAALTLGVGVNTAVFSVVDAVLLRPIGVPEPDRLVFLTTTSPQGSGIGLSASLVWPDSSPRSSTASANATRSCSRSSCSC